MNISGPTATHQQVETVLNNARVLLEAKGIHADWESVARVLAVQVIETARQLNNANIRLRDLILTMNASSPHLEGEWE